MEVVITFISQWGTLVLAGISLIVAVISLIMSAKAQHLQNKINNLEYLIKQYEIEKINNEKANANRTCVEARICNISRGNYRMKIWNSGDLIAKNITLVPDANANLIFMGEMLPYEELDVGKNFEIPIVVCSETARKFYVTTRWEDENANLHEKKQMVSLY